MPNKQICSHTGSKYFHKIRGQKDGYIDVYGVLKTFNVTEPGVAHAIKKLLMPGNRQKNDTRSDLVEAVDAIQRTIEILDSERKTSNDTVGKKAGRRSNAAKSKGRKHSSASRRKNSKNH